MFVTLVQVHVVDSHIDEFIAATEKNHRASIQEPDNRRVDILQSSDKPEYFVLYEAYSSAEDAAAHKQTPHYLEWRDTVADWMASSREGVAYNGLFPQG